MQADTLSVPPDDAPVEHRLRFTGTGSEYFRIWIVNLLLSVLTLGIYSAWAKVRREQYFHRNTLLDGSGFDYHGNPKAILKGRLIAVTLLFVLAGIDKAAHDFYYPALLLASPLVPWLMIRSFVFRSRNTSFRGLYFDFHGTYKGFCKMYFVPVLAFIAMGLTTAYAAEQIKADWKPATEDLRQDAGETPRQYDEYVSVKTMQDVEASNQRTFLTMLFSVSLLGMFLLMPVYMHRFKAFQFNNLAFGTSRFESRFRLKSFYGIYLRVAVLLPLLTVLALISIFLALIPILIVLFILVQNASASGVHVMVSTVFTTILVPLVYIGLLIGSQTWFAVLQSNLIWNKTRLNKHSFKSDQTFWSFFRVLTGNLLLMILTLGLYWPWARVRIARYRAEHTAVLAAGSLDDFVAGATREKSAISEEVADIFDFDFGF